MGSLRRTNFEKPLTSRPVPNDAESLWERTDNFVPAIPTAFEQEPELTIFVEENEAEQVAIIIIIILVIIIVEQVAREPEAGRILVFLKLYDPVSLRLIIPYNLRGGHHHHYYHHHHCHYHHHHQGEPRDHRRWQDLPKLSNGGR